MRRLVEEIFSAAYGNPMLNQLGDGTVFSVESGRLAFTTDSYVVRPLFFPGGDIGTLAVNGTVNDLAMCGAKPLYLSAGFILEEGFPLETLWRVAQSMRGAAEAAGVKVITGDTKVVDRGKGDGVYINTAGVGLVTVEGELSPGRIKPGDAALISGDIGRHGIAVMSEREGLSFESAVESDCAPLSELVMFLLDSGVEIHCLRDLTRGGLGSALVEIAESGNFEIHVEESAIPVSEGVRGACEILGLDPLYIANEGRFVCFVREQDAGRALELMRAHPLGGGSAVIGTARAGSPGLVTMMSEIGSPRIVDMPSGEQLPRIC